MGRLDLIVVWAKIKGHPWWPASTATGRDTSRAAIVTFLGTGEQSSVSPGNIEPFALDAKDDARFEPPKREALRGAFVAALEEAERMLNPPARLREPGSNPKKAATRHKEMDQCDSEQSESEAALMETLAEYLERRGGERSMLDGWRAKLLGLASGAGFVYCAPSGEVHRSKISVARHFELETPPGAAPDCGEVAEVRPKSSRMAAQHAAWLHDAPLHKSVRVRLGHLSTTGRADDDSRADSSRASASAKDASPSEKLAPSPPSGGASSSADGASAAAPSHKRGRPSPNYKFRAESAQHREPIRNCDASAIDQFGFAECNGLLDADLCARIAKENMEEAEGISNAFQKSLEGPILDETTECISRSREVADAIHAAFGVRRFVVKTVKVLMTEFCAEPQIPHADDFCNRELFGIAHLLPDQPRTECLPYNSHAAYPTNVSVECDKCGEWMPLPDRIARRREHVDSFCCADAGRTCGVRVPPQLPSLTRDAVSKVADVDKQASAATTTEEMKIDWNKLWRGPAKRRSGEEDEGLSPAVGAAMAAAVRADPFAADVCEAFRQMLDGPAHVIESMRPVGAPPKAGDGLVALPTLVHRGPGGNDTTGNERWVLFFTIQPVFEGKASDPDFDMNLGEYDAEAQIHAGWLLWRAGKVLGPEVPRVVGLYEDLGFNLGQFGKGEKLRYKSDGSHEEWSKPGKRRKEKADKAEKADSAKAEKAMKAERAMAEKAERAEKAMAERAEKAEKAKAAKTAKEEARAVAAEARALAADARAVAAAVQAESAAVAAEAKATGSPSSASSSPVKVDEEQVGREDKGAGGDEYAGAGGGAVDIKSGAGGEISWGERNGGATGDAFDMHTTAADVLQRASCSRKSAARYLQEGWPPAQSPPQPSAPQPVSVAACSPQQQLHDRWQQLQSMQQRLHHAAPRVSGSGKPAAAAAATAASQLYPPASVVQSGLSGSPGVAQGVLQAWSSPQAMPSPAISFAMPPLPQPPPPQQQQLPFAHAADPSMPPHMSPQQFQQLQAQHQLQELQHRQQLQQQEQQLMQLMQRYGGNAAAAAAVTGTMEAHGLYGER